MCLNLRAKITLHIVNAISLLFVTLDNTAEVVSRNRSSPLEHRTFGPFSLELEIAFFKVVIRGDIHQPAVLQQR